MKFNSIHHKLSNAIGQYCPSGIYKTCHSLSADQMIAQLQITILKHTNPDGAGGAPTGVPAGVSGCWGTRLLVRRVPRWSPDVPSVQCADGRPAEVPAHTYRLSVYFFNFRFLLWLAVVRTHLSEEDSHVLGVCQCILSTWEQSGGNLHVLDMVVRRCGLKTER